MSASVFVADVLHFVSFQCQSSVETACLTVWRTLDFFFFFYSTTDL